MAAKVGIESDEQYSHNPAAQRKLVARITASEICHSELDAEVLACLFSTTFQRGSLFNGFVTTF
jgi:hypothetical protein